jgi:hypothetical protein
MAKSRHQKKSKSTSRKTQHKRMQRGGWCIPGTNWGTTCEPKLTEANVEKHKSKVTRENGTETMEEQKTNVATDNDSYLTKSDANKVEPKSSWSWLNPFGTSAEKKVSTEPPNQLGGRKSSRRSNLKRKL